MGYVGAKTIPDLKKNAEFLRISKASYKESHAHDLSQIKDAPNYKAGNE
jgi:IMP dehydrogenase